MEPVYGEKLEAVIDRLEAGAEDFTESSDIEDTEVLTTEFGVDVEWNDILEKALRMTALDRNHCYLRMKIYGMNGQKTEELGLFHPDSTEGTLHFAYGLAEQYGPENLQQISASQTTRPGR